jgi:hypothetical protein
MKHSVLIENHQIIIKDPSPQMIKQHISFTSIMWYLSDQWYALSQSLLRSKDGYYNFELNIVHRHNHLRRDKPYCAIAYLRHSEHYTQTMGSIHSN